MKSFGICIEDGSEHLPRYVVDHNTSFMSLYEWQRKAIDYFFSKNNAIFEVTTGAGKTISAIRILKQILEKEDIKILIVVPKNVILEDTWWKELYENGFSVVDIGVFYGTAREYGKNITITNMQNLDRITFDIFDMIIFDEVHNYGTKKLLPYLEKKCKYKLGLSATVERMDGNHLKILKAFDYNVFKYTPQEALDDSVLNPFVFINVGVEMDSDSFERYTVFTQELNVILQAGGGYKRIMRKGGGLKYKMLSKMNERKELVYNYPRKFDVIKEICKKHKKDKIIVFNQYNQQTNKAYWYLLDIGVKSCIVHSDIPKEKRDQNMIDFRNDRYQIMLTSKVLDEGYNLPKLDVAIIAAGDSTSRQTIQRMGRVLRKKENESHLYQIYCGETIEEVYADERGKLFKELCSDYKQYFYDGEILK